MTEYCECPASFRACTAVAKSAAPSVSSFSFIFQLLFLGETEEEEKVTKREQGTAG
jgi:hypothetical protein